MTEQISKKSQAVVFQTPEGTLVWDTLENSTTGAQMIKEREDQGNQTILITTPEEARKMVRQRFERKD